MTDRTYVDIHILQTVPPSNLNRDDAGSPKQAVYGGVRRARVSSQCWKRATRKLFAERLPEDQLATRTKRIATKLTDRLVDRCHLDTEQATRIATSMLSQLGITAGKKAQETSYLLFFGRQQLEQLVDLVAGRVEELAAMDDKTLKAAADELEVKKVLGEGHPIAVALFGRMVADLPSLNVDAATQVAHALSTHQAELQFDYYTAVDDEKDRERGDDVGAGMIGTIEFNSATLYRFASVGLHQLVDNLADPEAAATALSVFLECFTKSMPTGHENSFAHRTLPSLVSVVVREDQPVNLVSAFEAPVRANGSGLAEESALSLAAELRQANEQWGLTPLLVSSTYAPQLGEQVGDVLGAPKPFDAVVAEVVELARQRLTAGVPA